MSTWRDLEKDLERKLGREFTEEESGALHGGMQATIGLPPDALVHAVELVGTDQFCALMVDGDDAYLIGFADAVTTVEFLGPLAGGRYSERIQPIERGYSATLSFQHERLGDREIRVSRDAVSPMPGAVPRFDEETDAARWTRLREQLRAWAAPV